jgi:hypothetical protein
MGGRLTDVTPTTVGPVATGRTFVEGGGDAREEMRADESETDIAFVRRATEPSVGGPSVCRRWPVA